MAFDAGDIFRTYLQGASFVSDSLDRADARRRQAEEEELQKVAGRGLEIFAPKYDKEGNLIPRTSGDIFNDPQTLELANHPYMKSARMQGITDPNVKDVRYVSGAPLEDGRHVVPIVEQLDEDGNVISRGPLTEGRSRDGKSKVVPITVDTMFNHLAGEVYRRNPMLGKELMTRSREQALTGLQTQYRNTQDPNEREQLVQIAGSYGYAPDSLIKDSGTPVVQPNLELGLDKVVSPDGGFTYRTSPTTEGLRKTIQDRTNKEALEQREVTQVQDANVGLSTAPVVRQTAEVLHPVTADNEAKTLEARKVLGDVKGLLDGGATESYKRVAELAPYLDKDQRGGLRAQLLTEGPRAAPALRALAEVDGGLKGDAPAPPKPAKFNSAGVVKWNADAPEEERRKTQLLGEQLFRDALPQFPATEGSQAETDLNMAVGEALREGLPNHVLPLVNWVQMQKDPEYAGGIKTSREFIEEVHTPIVELAKKNGLGTTPQTLAPIEQLATKLMARNVGTAKAVAKAVELWKDPALKDKIMRLLPSEDRSTPAEREKLFLDILKADSDEQDWKDFRGLARGMKNPNFNIQDAARLRGGR